MNENRNLALRRRVLPFTPLELMLEEHGGSFYRMELKLAFNMNAGAALQERTAGLVSIRELEGKTVRREYPNGLMLTDYAIWNHVGEPKVLRAMLWAAALAYQPEYDTGDDEGLLTIGSYIQEENSDAIVEALWKAYLAFVPPAKRDALAKAKEEAEKGAETKRPLVETIPQKSETPNPTGTISAPSPDTTLESASTNSAS